MRDRNGSYAAEVIVVLQLSSSKKSTSIFPQRNLNSQILKDTLPHAFSTLRCNVGFHINERKHCRNATEREKRTRKQDVATRLKNFAEEEKFYELGEDNVWSA